MTEETIDANAYVLGIKKSEIFSSIYKIFYNRIVNNVSDIQSPARSKWWYPAFPDNSIDTSSAYPIGIINSPEVAWSKFTIKKKWVNFTIDIEVFVTKQTQLDSLSNEILSVIEASYPTFTGIQLRMVTLDNTSTDHIIRDKITIHNKVLTFKGQWSFVRTID